MTRSDAELVEDILEACDKIAEIVDEGRSEYDDNWKSLSAASHQLAIIGEAIGHLSPQFIDQNPDLPVRQAKSLRNLVIHEYFNVNPQILWDTMVHNIPVLVASLGSSVAGLEG